MVKPLKMCIPYAPPDTSIDGAVIIIGWKLDTDDFFSGVSGNHILLGQVRFLQSTSSIPTLSLALGRSGSYENFVAVDGIVIDNVVNFRAVVARIKKGDINGDETVGLTDAVLTLQVLPGNEPPGVYSGDDVNDNDKIGLAEAIYVLQHVSELS